MQQPITYYLICNILGFYKFKLSCEVIPNHCPNSEVGLNVNFCFRSVLEVSSFAGLYFDVCNDALYHRHTREGGRWRQRGYVLPNRVKKVDPLGQMRHWRK